MSDQFQELIDWADQKGLRRFRDESPESLASETWLNLYREELRELPEAIGCLKSLKRLDLRFNPIERLPDSIGQLVQLENLDLVEGRLTSVPASIGRLQNLSYLRIDSCDLPVLPESLGQLRALTQLHLSGNRLTTLPASMSQLTRLQYLSLDGNQFASLPDWLGKLPSLVWLDLRNNPLTQLPSGLGRMKNLYYLAFDKNRVLDPPQLACITEMLRRPLGKLQAVFAETLSYWGHQLPAEDVIHRRRGKLGDEDGDYGWGDTVKYLFGSDEHGEYVDYFLHHRLAGDRHGRIYEDGSTKDLPTIPIGRLGSDDPVVDARLEAESRVEYEQIMAMLEAKGFED